MMDLDATGGDAGFPEDAGPEAGGDAGLGQQEQRVPRWFKQRIDEITAQKHEANRVAEAERAERARLASEIAALREQMGQATGQGKPKGWDDLAPDDLHKMVAEEFANLSGMTKDADGNPIAANPNMMAKAIRELVRKEAAALVNSEKANYAKASEAEKGINAMRAQVFREYPDAANPQSEIRQKAEQIWAGLEQKYGKEGLRERLAQVPDLELLTFRSAEAELVREGKRSNRQQAQELEDLRRQAGVGAGGVDQSESNSRYSAALKKNDLDGAAKELARAMLRGGG